MFILKKCSLSFAGEALVLYSKDIQFDSEKELQICRHSSVVECFCGIEVVAGSNPAVGSIFITI